MSETREHWERVGLLSAWKTEEEKERAAQMLEKTLLYVLAREEKEELTTWVFAVVARIMWRRNIYDINLDKLCLELFQAFKEYEDIIKCNAFLAYDLEAELIVKFADNFENTVDPKEIKLDSVIFKTLYDKDNGK